MFKLITIEDTISVPPNLFGQPRLAALEHAINKRFSDRVIPHYGLCIALWDWVKVSEDRLIAHSGNAATLCTFRMVVFAPFPGEVLFSRINASHDTGLYLEMGFFDAIHVRKEALPTPSSWDESEKVWVWKPEVGGGELFMDVSNECVFRCLEVVYEERMKVRPTERDPNTGVMTIWGSIHDKGIENNQGLGDPLWWEEGEEAAAEDGEEGYEEDGQYDQEAEGGYEEGDEGGYEEGAEGGHEEGAEGGHEEGAEGGHEEGAEGGHEDGLEGGHKEKAEGRYELGAEGSYEGVEEKAMQAETGGEAAKEAHEDVEGKKPEANSGVPAEAQVQPMAVVKGEGVEDGSNDHLIGQSDGDKTGPRPKAEAVIKEELRRDS